MPWDEEELLLYVSMTPQVVSVVLVVEREEEHPGYRSPDHGSKGAPGDRTPDPRKNPTQEATTELLVLNPGITPDGHTEQPHCTQRLVYFVREVLRETKEHYLQVQKMLYAVPMASRKHYVQAHKVTMVMSYPLGLILRNREGTGCTIKWVIELAEFVLQFTPQHAVMS